MGEISIALDVWRLISAPLHALFDNLANAADSLHTVIMSLINSKREFCEILTPPSSKLEFTEYYSSFNKWLLGRLFYILSVEKLKKIHFISIEAQLKILSILMANGATFYREICNDYIESGKALIKYYSSIEDEDCELEVLHLRMLIPRLINIPNTDINFSPIFIKVSDKNLCRSLIKNLSKILQHIMPLSIALEEYKITDDIVAQHLFILENFDFDLKIIAIKFFTNILNEHGAPPNSDDFLIKFMLGIESLILYMPVYANNGLLYHSKQIAEFNEHIAQALTAVTSLSISSQEIRTCVELNICKFVLSLDEPAVDNESLDCTFNLELKKSCVKLLEKIFRTGGFISAVDIPVTKYFIKNASTLYTSLIASQLKTYIYIDKNESNDVSLDVMKSSPTAERLLSALTFSLESACCLNIDLFVIREHLQNCLNTLRIIHDSSIEFYSTYQQYKGFHNAIFNIKVTDKHNKIHSKFKLYEERVRLLHIPRDKTKMIVKNITEVMNRILEKNSEPLSEIFICMEICMMMLLLSIEISLDDLLSVLRITRLTLNQPSFSAKFHEMLHLHTLNIISVQSILNYKEMKKNTIERLEVFDLNNPEIHAKILRISPLLIINEILSPEKIISDYLFSALHLKDKNILDVVITILPIMTCILYGHYAVIKSKHGDFKESVGFELPSVDGVHLSLICLHCYNCNDDKFIQRNVENNLKNNRAMLLLNKSRLNYSESNDSTSNVVVLFQRLSSAEFYESVDILKLYKFVVTISQHSLIIPQIIDYILTERNLQNVSADLKPFFSIVLTDPKVEDSVKNNIRNTFLTSLLSSVKSSLHGNDIDLQLICLNAVRQFGMSRSETVLLPSVKILLYFLMNPNTPFGFMANFYTKDICESHSLSTNLVYHMYKKDFCRIMMGLLSWNYSMKQEFVPSILRVVRVFGFINYKEFISKEMHHALPFLIPLILRERRLRQIIPEISELISCNPSDFLYDRFPHIYAHVYIFSTDEIANKCYDYLVEIIRIPLPTLIKKHSRVILTELLFQYCCDPERVIKACRQLASIDSDNETNVNYTIPLMQVADYIQPKILGVLAYFDSKLIHTKIAISVKRKALQSFPYILNLMGTKHITPLRFKILATLRTASTLMKEFPDLNIEAWDAFVRNIDTILLGSLLTTIVVSLLPLMLYSSKKLNKIFEYLIVENENILSAHIADLYFLETTDVSECIKGIVMRYVDRNQSKSFICKMQWYMKYLNQDTPEIKVYALKYLNELIKSQRRELDLILYGNNNYISVIAELLEILIVGCRNKDSNLAEWSSRCLGQIGALQPSLLPRKLALTSSESQFAFNMGDVSFARMALIELAKAFQFEKNPKNMDCYSLAIQEILNSFNIRPQGENKEVWDSLPKNLLEIIVPLLLSRYTLAFPSNPEKSHPIFGSPSATTFSEWGFNWAGKLISHIKQDEICYMLRMVHPALKRDLRTLVLFLPYIVLHTVTTNSDLEFIKEEIMSVIGMNSFNVESINMKKLPDYKIMRYVNTTPSITPIVSEEGTHKKCCKMIYNLLDFFNRWLMEWCYNKNNSLQDNDYVKIKDFINQFCKLTIARGNFLCSEYERSLQYLELYMEESPERFQSQLGFLAEIYSVLNEPDSIAGIMSIKQNEPTLSESILAHEVMGQLQDAATCYEKLAQQGNFGGEKLQGMVKVYLGLDQPFTALRLLQDADVEFNGDGLAAESFWRLGMFEELDKMLSRPDVANNDTWGVNIGHCLLALRSGVRENLQEKLSSARRALLRRLDSGVSYMSLEENIYDRAYTSAFDLHMISEIEDIEDIIFRIKDLHDGDTDCVVIINHLIEEWNLRFNLLQSSKNIVEPVLRLRRILLEQSKELLQDTHPRIIPLLDIHIGKLWLRSAKFARKAGIYQQAYIYILNSEKYSPKELFIEKAKLYWMRNQTEPAFCTLKRGLEEHFIDTKKLAEDDKKLCAKAKLLIAIYNDETTNVDMDVNIKHYKDAMLTYREWEKSLICLGEYYEKIYTALTPSEKLGGTGCAARTQALDYYGRSLQYGHKKLYQSMPRMLTIWLDFEITSENKSTALAALTNICTLIETFTERLPLYLFLSAFSQIISRICHPIKEVYNQLKSVIIKLILAYPQHSLWMMMCVIKSGYSQRMKRCQDILNDHRLKDPEMQKFISHFNLLATNLIDLCNTQVNKDLQTFTVSSLVRNLPRILATSDFSEIVMPHERFVKLSLPVTTARNERNYNPFTPPVYIAGIEEKVVVLQSLQKPRKVTFLGSDGNRYIIMLKPKDDLRKDFRLMEFNAVVNRYLQDHPDARERRLYIRTYTVLPLNEECGLIEWVPNLLGLRPILSSIYKRKGLSINNKQLRSWDCDLNDSIAKKKKIFETELLPRHPPVFGEWFRSTFPDPHSWYQARSAYTRTTAVMSMVGYILGLGDRHGENILFDSTNGDTMHVDFNCLFNKGEGFLRPETVPFRLTHNMQSAMGPLAHEGMYRKCCEVTMRVLRAQTPTLMAIIRPFVYDPLVTWQKCFDRSTVAAERTNQSAKEHLTHIEHRLEGMVRTKDKQFTLSLSPEGQTNHLILEAISVVNLCQMYMGWGPFL